MIESNELKTLINQYGMPMIAAGGMGYFIYFVWKFVTENINGKLAEAKNTMLALIDRIRMLDNDMIRLEQKINTSIELKRTTSEVSNTTSVTEPLKPNEATQHHPHPDTPQQPPTSGN